MSEDILLCSIAPYDIRLERPYCLALQLKAADKQLGYSSVWITEQHDHKRIYHDLKNIEMIRVDITPTEILSDLMANENLARQGCFVGTGKKQSKGADGNVVKDAKGNVSYEYFPTVQEIAKGKESRRVWLAKSVAEGDALYGKYGARGIEQIPDYCKRAAVELGVEKGRPWLFIAPEAIQQCQRCGTVLPHLQSGGTVSICLQCGAIIDPERDATFKVAGDATQPKEQEQRKRA